MRQKFAQVYPCDTSLHPDQDLHRPYPTNYITCISHINAQSTHASVYSRIAHHHGGLLKPSCPNIVDTASTIRYSNMADLCITASGTISPSTQNNGIVPTTTSSLLLQVRCIPIPHCSWRIPSLQMICSLSRQSISLSSHQRSKAAKHNEIFHYNLHGDSMSSLAWAQAGRVNSSFARRGNIIFTTLSIHLDTYVAVTTHIPGVLNVLYDRLSCNVPASDLDADTSKEYAASGDQQLMAI